jgi:hypothetical protein
VLLAAAIDRRIVVALPALDAGALAITLSAVDKADLPVVGG